MRMSTLLEEVRKFSVDEAVSPAQQAAIAISKKERGEKPKKEEVVPAPPEEDSDKKEFLFQLIINL